MTKVVSMFSPPKTQEPAIPPATPVLPPTPEDDEEEKKRREAVRRRLLKEKEAKTQTQFTGGGLGTSPAPSLGRKTLLGG